MYEYERTMNWVDVGREAQANAKTVTDNENSERTQKFVGTECVGECERIEAIRHSPLDR